MSARRVGPEERERLAVASLWLVGVLALVFAFQRPAYTEPPRPDGPAGFLSPLLFGLIAAAGFLAALYRPRPDKGLGAGLGLGTAAVPLALAGWGAAPVALAFAVTAAAAGFAAAREREEDLAPRRLFGGAACAALGTLAAGWVQVRIEQSGAVPPAALAAAVAGGAFVAVRLLGEALAFPPGPGTAPAISWTRLRAGLLTVGLEAAAWTIGSLLALAHDGEEGQAIAVVLLFAFALTAAEAGRQAALRRRSEAAQSALSAAMALDPLTGLQAEARLEPALAAAFARSLENAEPFAVALFDVDHLRRINEAHGRAAGSDALKALGRAVAAQAGPGDVVVRASGGRLALLQDASDGARSLAAAEAARRAVEAGFAGAPSFTASAGVAAAPEVFARSGEELLLLAEGALRHAKDLGRNLCLLDLGGGRYRDGGGSTLDTVEGGRELKSPQIFA